MKPPLLALSLVVLVGLGCGSLHVYGGFYLPEEATATAARAAETYPVQTPATTTSTSAVAATSFTGIWQGVDPLDGSITTLSLVQEGNAIRGTFEDAYSPTVDPPGFQGNGSGRVRTATTAEITFELTRWDGMTLTESYLLTLWDSDGMMTLDCSICPVSQELHRQ